MSSHRTILLIAITVLLVVSSILVTLPVEGQQSESTTFHLNMKEGEDLGLETEPNDDNEVEQRVNADYDEPVSGYRPETYWTDVGTWTTSDSLQYDLTVATEVTFNIWWHEIDEGFGNEAQFRFTLKNGEVDICETETPIQNHEDETYAELTINGNLNGTNLKKGDNFALYIEYKGREDAMIAFDSPQRHSGVYLSGNAIAVFDAYYSGSTITVEFIQPWRVNVDNSLKGNFIQLSIDGQPQDNNRSDTQSGTERAFSNGTATSTTVIWDLETAVTGSGEISLGVAFGPSSDPNVQTTPLMVQVGSSSSSGDDDDSPGLGLGGFIVAISLAFALGRRGRKET